MNWLLEQNAYDLITQAGKGSFVPSADQQTSFDARFSSEGGDSSSRILSLAGSSAEVSIKGALTKEPNILAFLFGGGNTTYAEIVAALIDADQDGDVEETILAIDSPGGQFEGMYTVIDQINKMTKPVKAVISNTGASAAYAIACQADSIVVTNSWARVGSVGVLATVPIDDSTVSIASTNAPKKHPDVTTEAGVAIVKETVDAMHQIFVESIASGRGTTVEKVNADFGQGATLLADEALKVGMIDGIKGDTAIKPIVKTADKGGRKQEATSMDIQTLKAQHPDVFTAAMEEGVTQERDRVVGHINAGQQTGAMDTACKAITDGSLMTQTLISSYMTAGMAQTDITARDSDNADAAGADGVTDDQGISAADQVADVVAALRGTEEV